MSFIGVVIRIIFAWVAIFGSVSFLVIKTKGVGFLDGFQGSIIALICFLISCGVTAVIWNKWEGDYTPTPEKCPKCRSENHEVINVRTSSHDGTEMVTKRTTHYNNDGEETGYSEHEVEEPYTITYSYTDHKCGSCGHTWTT